MGVHLPEGMSESSAPSSEEEPPELRGQDNIGREEVMYVFEMIESPAITTGDVRGLTGCSTERARELLRELEQEGEVRSRRTSSGYMWWRTNPEKEVPMPDLYELDEPDEE